MIGSCDAHEEIELSIPAYPLFPADLPRSEWIRFEASGFEKPACGVIYDLESRLTNGMPLGGVDTGCIDLDPTGLLGYCTIFNTHIPRRGPMNMPFLGIGIGERTWILCHPVSRDGEGGSQQSAEGRPYNLWRGDGLVKEVEPITPIPTKIDLGEVETATGISYWGHYPVADLQFETSSPVQVALRAWSPFLPGDLITSMIPAITWEVRLHNQSDTEQSGAIVLSFPGPTVDEAGEGGLRRNEIRGEIWATEVVGEKVSYVLATTGKSRGGGGLGLDGLAWSRITEELPAAGDDPGASRAIDFTLSPGEGTVVRFILAWHCPTWNAGGYNWAGAEHEFTHMYSSHYQSALETATGLAKNHASLLQRVLAWQQVVYGEEELPVWLRESLVNNLHLITEDGMWAQAGDPLPRWVRHEDGLFGMNECPRGCPQIECIPCSFYGNQPLVYFFPELALSTLRGYAGYQYPDGAAVWVFGGCTGGTPPIDFANPTRGYQFATNGISLATMVDRYSLCHGSADFTREFYPKLRENMLWTLNLRTTPSFSKGDRVISMPDPDSDETATPPTEWFEAREPGWLGMTAHVGGLHLAQLRIVQRLAREAGDDGFARDCERWIEAGAESMEKRLWNDGYYLNYLDPETGARSDLIFGYQMDGEWIVRHHGLDPILPENRVMSTLETIERVNVGLTKYGAVNYANPDGTPSDVGGYGTYSYFPPEALMLAMTYIYAGKRQLGLDIARRVWHNIVCRHGYTWDMPNIMRGDEDTGERTFGNDYYQDMMLWSLPAALSGDDFSGPCAPGGIVTRVIRAAREGR